MAEPSLMQQPYLDTKCHRCHGSYKLPDNGQQWHLVCNECGAILLVYQPLPHQKRFHQDPARIRGFFGGYGSGKTTTTVMEMIRHQLSTPNGTSLMGAATFPQLEQTSMKEWFEIMPASFIKNYSKQKNYVDLINGHRVLFRALDDEGKARSLNLTGFHIEEASEVNYEYFVQLLTRLRNRATNHHIAVLSSNPDMGWIKTEILLKAKNIYNSEVKYHQDPDEINDNISVHIAPTHLNTYLPPNFRENTARGRPDWWIRRYLDGSFENKQGLVYPQWEESLVDPFEIPEHWEKMQASDFGINDPTVALWGAIDPRTGIVYIYDEHYERGKAVPYHAEQMKKRLNKIPFGKLRFIVGDPSGASRSHSDMRSVFDHYAEYGVYFSPGTNKLEDGIYKVYSFFELGRIKIFKTCKNTINEIKEYRYPEDSDSLKRNIGDKPIDKNNHAMDCLRYMIAELPDDPDDLKTEHYSFYSEYNRLKPKNFVHALQEDDTLGYNADEWVNYY